MRPALHSLVTAAWSRALAEGRVAPTAPPPVAVDFETFYRTEKLAKKTALSPCTVELSGNWAYCRHPEWDAYLVALYSPAHPALELAEISYAGPAAGAPWAALAQRRWLSHNRNFDRHAHERLVELGLVPAVAYQEWHDTADLAVYCHLPRALARAASCAYNLTLDKDARSTMDGVRWSDLPPGEQARVQTYALEDAAVCCALWLDHAHRWPEEERFASLHTGEIEFRGIAIDCLQVEQDITVLETARWKAMTAIPWFDTEDERGKPIALRSKKALDRECFRCGVPPPSSTSVKSKEFQEWLDEYGHLVPPIHALAHFRSIDRALGIYRHLRARLRPDGRAALGLKYMGADKTGRWSGAAKFNLQNLIKVALAFRADYSWATERDTARHLVDIRRCLVAGPGCKLVIPDLAQIEPRVLNWLVGNESFLAHCRAGLSPYEAHAKDSGYTWEGKLKHTAPGMYALFKARVLALGYGAGWEKFIGMARGYCESEEQFLSVFAVEPAPGDEEKFLRHLTWLVKTLQHRPSHTVLEHWPGLGEDERRIAINAWRQVTSFRQGNPLLFDRVHGLAPRLEAAFRAAADEEVFLNRLPSGRTLAYFEVATSCGWSARQGNLLAPRTHLYGGKLVENYVQAVARDVFLLGINRLERAGYRVLFHVHDEAIVEAPASADPAEIARLLTVPPDWAPTLPVAFEYEVSLFYKK
jgi:hypothetical protein